MHEPAQAKPPIADRPSRTTSEQADPRRTVAGNGIAERLLQLQRSHGNRFVQQHLEGLAVSRDPLPGIVPPGPGSPPVTPAQPAQPAARPDRSALRTIAETAINAEYASAARDGLADFESIVGADIDPGTLMTNLAGNVMWATACFATGGGALAISLVGIGISTVSPATGTNVDRAAFHTFAAGQISGITSDLLNQIVAIADGVDAEATSNNWDDMQTRGRLMRALFRPEFIAVAGGGLPTLNRSAVAHRVATDLLTRANAFSRGRLFDTGARVIYDYSLSNYSDDHGFWPFDSTTIRPEPQWVFARGSTSIYVAQGGQGTLDELRRDPLIQPAQLPFGKTVFFTGDDHDAVEVYLDAANVIYAAHGYGAFEDLGAAPSRGPSRSPPPPADPIGAARRICAAAWLGTNGLPPWVRTQDLGLAAMPGRSRATR